MTQPSETPTLSEVMREFVAEGLGSTHTCEVGRVSDYDADTQTATVQPVVRGRFVDADTGESEFELPPPIPNVPVAFPSGGGQSITWPLEQGDIVTLVYAERSLDEWQATGGADNEPADTRRHDRTDAIALPAGRSPADPLDAGRTDPSRVVFQNGQSKFTIGNDGKFALRNEVSAAEFVTLVYQLVQALQTAVVATSLGPQPLDPATQSTLQGILSQLKTLKE